MSDDLSLVQLLEQLPLPLRLQTAEGEVLQENSAWLEQFGDRKLVLESQASAWLTPKVEGKSNFFDTPLHPECQQENHYLLNISLQQQLSLLQETKPSQHQSLVKVQSLRDRIWQLSEIPLHWQYHQQTVYLVVATDITEQEKLYKELAAKNADLVQLNRLKDEFLACISHELKSPLTAVVGLSSLLKQNKLGALNERQARYAEQIYHSGHQLMNLVNDILDLTRIETGQLQLNFEPVSIKSVCQRAYEETLSHQLLKAKYSNGEQPEIQFHLEIEPDLDTIVADEMRLRQMLVHLLDNAYKFTKPGGEIGLKVNRWNLWVAFTVWDTGIGIPPAYQHLLFQKFQQLENPLTRQFEGTGLGLVLTQKLARAHGGDVSFISKVDQGSQFMLLLPPNLTQPENIALKYDSAVSNQLVLLVESVPRYIEHLTKKLLNLEYRVMIARTGTEALTMARQLQPCVVFLNPILPLLSGWDVLTLLKADRQTKKIPVIITATRAEQQQAQQNGANAFLSLPVEQSALEEALESCSQPILSKQSSLTILHLHPTISDHNVTDVSNHSWLDTALRSRFAQASQGQYVTLQHRIVEADSLEQAATLARVWHLDVILLDIEFLPEPETYLQKLSSYEQLAGVPLITLDTKTTEVANQIKGLSVFPCLAAPNDQKLDNLMQVIEIAAVSNL